MPKNANSPPVPGLLLWPGTRSGHRFVCVFPFLDLLSGDPSWLDASPVDTTWAAGLMHTWPPDLPPRHRQADGVRALPTACFHPQNHVLPGSTWKQSCRKQWPRGLSTGAGRLAQRSAPRACDAGVWGQLCPGGGPATPSATQLSPRDRDQHLPLRWDFTASPERPHLVSQSLTFLFYSSLGSRKHKHCCRPPLHTCSK